MDRIDGANTIDIGGVQEVLVNGGGSYTRFNAGGIEHGTAGSYTLHAGSRGTPGPQSVPLAMPPTICVECMRRALEQASPMTART